MRLALQIVRGILILAAFAAVLVRPGYGERPAETEVADVEVMVVIDRTRSMSATDWDGEKPRVDGVQQDVRDLVDALPGTRFSLITWGTGARLELPFTSDSVSITDAVRNLRLEDPYQSDGTKVDTPLKVMADELERAEKQYPDRRRMLVFMSDGEDTKTASGSSDDATTDSFADLAESVDGGLVLGYGTAEGAPMPASPDLSDKDGNLQVDGKDAVSKADPDNLKKIADDTGTTYVAREKPGGMDELTDDFAGEYIKQPGTEAGPQHDLTWVAGLVLFVLMLWVLHGAWRSIWTAPAALGEARGRRRTPERVGDRS